MSVCICNTIIDACKRISILLTADVTAEQLVYIYNMHMYVSVITTNILHHNIVIFN